VRQFLPLLVELDVLGEQFHHTRLNEKPHKEITKMKSRELALPSPSEYVCACPPLGTWFRPASRLFGLHSSEFS
jgi:hypothetical protein